MRSFKRESLGEAEINLTPLIDVCFVILIMFIVVAPLLEMEKITLSTGPSLDQPHICPVKERSQVTIHVFQDDTVAINGHTIPITQLKKVLAALKERYPAANPQVFHDRNAKFGTYQLVKNALEDVGFTEMHLVLKPE